MTVILLKGPWEWRGRKEWAIESGEFWMQNVPAPFLSVTGIINAVVQMNRETQGDKQAGVPAS